MTSKEEILAAKLSMSLEEISKNPPGGRSGDDNSGGFGASRRRRSRDSLKTEDDRSSSPYSRPQSSESNVTNRIYVGNLSWQTSWQDLKDHMRKAGTVVYADVFLDDQGKSKGCGIVEYATREEALEAIRTLTDTKIGSTDRPIFVREDRESPNFQAGSKYRNSRGGYYGGGGGGGGGRYGGGNNSHYGGSGSHYREERSHSSGGRQVYVGNLPYTTTWQELKDHFRSVGRVVRADTLTGADGRSKGSGTVLFESRHDAQKAIEVLNNTEFQGRTIFIQEDKFA